MENDIDVMDEMLNRDPIELAFSMWEYINWMHEHEKSSYDAKHIIWVNCIWPMKSKHKLDMQIPAFNRWYHYNRTHGCIKDKVRMI